MVRELNTVNITLICDDNYIIPTMTTIASIKTTKKDDTYCKIHVIANSTNDDLYDIFNALQTDSFEIHTIIVNEEMVNELASTMGDSYCVATPSALMKFFIPNLIQGVEKILYLDGDIIVRDDLYDLYSTDLEDAYGAVVIDSTKLYSGREVVKNNDCYFNSGVMLLNTKLMATVIEQLIETKMKQVDQTLMDQDVFNLVIGKNVKCLPIKYNFLYTNLNRARDNFEMADLNKLYATNYVRLKNIYDDAVIVHFSSKDKPWKCINSPMARIWYEAYREMKKNVLSFGDTYKQVEKFEKKLVNDKGLFNAVNSSQIDFKRKLIVSLTSFPERIEYIYRTIETILDQSEIPDRVILWLAEEEFPDREKDLPKNLLLLENDGLEIKWCENIRSHKKYVYSMLQNPSDIIITADDDILYDQNMISYLFKSYLKFPTCVSSNRVHAIGFDEEGKISRYMDWPQEIENMYQIPSYGLIPTGVGGVLYPPDCLDKSVLDVRAAEEICPTTDDIWLKLMAVIHGTKTVCAYPNIELKLIKETQKVALYKGNRVGGENDRQFNTAIDYCSKMDSDLLEKIYGGYQEIAEKISVPTVSVIIPLNNSVCDMGNIKSLLNQSLKNVQYIVLDNGSKGNVGRKLIEDERVVYISNKDWSIGKEVNYALTLVQGEYVLIADTDTYYHYDFLKKNYINARNSNADVTLFKINYYDHINERVRNSEWEKRFHRIPAELNFNFKDLLQDRFNTFSYRVTDKLYKREYLCENNEQLNEEGNGYGDFAFIFSTVINANRISYESEVLALQDYREKCYHCDMYKWNFVYKSLKSLKEYLKKELAWNDAVMQDYDNFALGVMLHEYHLVNSKQLEERYNALRDYEFNNVLSSNQSREYYYDQKQYEQLQYIKNTEYLWRVVKECIGVANFDVEQMKQLKKKSDELREKNASIDGLKKQINSLNDRISQLENAEYCLEETRKSKSYKLGLLITSIPRKLIRRK